MYHYIESGLSNIYLKNGFTVEHIDGEEYTSIDDMNGLHRAIGQAVVDSRKPLTNEEFKFLRIEMNISQKMLGTRFGVDEQTIARYEKGKTKIPRTTDAALRTLYMESQEKNNPVSYFLDLLADTEAEEAAKVIRLEEIEDHWEVAA
ncbi:DNA-binding transcriptional regulator YiaG [Idiomarina fontislapidosi]|uniref:Transcriptional regulator n=1 Tax=Idiomarina fontislapidosi TaxID=263723 RepID=A0A432XJV5_9GAMM|nr:helix-turn-helix domain-containing protein [Idiomarina fontislapidosi]PYE30224.1 DNA-binding transcriptional regulator YiaG [Idiomarina fontislapidosi]RUO48902.1 transcriptional regulator [Idiomarina fontislapidosi]